MLSKGNVLHFINRVDETNCGDKIVTPLLYYYDYFKQYQIKRHDIRYIDFDSISASDVVIIGGGGLFDYAEFSNRAINRVLRTGACVIAWSPGFNTHTEYSDSFQEKIKFDQFSLLNVRDYQNGYGLEYLPDITCKLPGLHKKYTVQRTFGIARHKDYPIENLEYDTITNDSSIEDILRFIGESEVIISNSFHMIYWSILMGKKTICTSPFSSKFFSYKYKPVYYWPEENILAECVKQAKHYDVLEECIQSNDKFFEAVKEKIEERLTPSGNTWAFYDFVTQEAILRQGIRETQLQKGDMLSSQLYIDVGHGFQENSRLVAINNVYGDLVHRVRFNLSDFSEIRALRFDPIDCGSCEVRILSARTEARDVTPFALVSVRDGDADRFLTTDPQYYIHPPCTGFLEITFTLKILSHSESEQNICTYADWMENQVRIRNEQLESQQEQITKTTAHLEQQSELITQQNTQLGQQSELITQQNTQLGQQSEQIAQQNMQLEQQVQQITQQNLFIREQNMRLEQTCSQLKDKTEELEKEKIQLEYQTAENREQRRQLEIHCKEIAQLQELTTTQNTELERLQNSLSWRITAPLRAIRRWLMRICKGKE